VLTSASVDARWVDGYRITSVLTRGKSSMAMPLCSSCTIRPFIPTTNALIVPKRNKSGTKVTDSSFPCSDSRLLAIAVGRQRSSLLTDIVPNGIDCMDSRDRLAHTLETSNGLFMAAPALGSSLIRSFEKLLIQIFLHISLYSEVT